MGTYPIKILSDEQGTPFVPLVSSDSVQTSDGGKLTDLIDAKMSTEDLIAGQYVVINQEGGKATIGVDLPASLNTINNLTTETSGQGALDAYQGKVLKDSIPVLVDSLDSDDANKALSARQGKILGEKLIPDGGSTGQVLKKGDNGYEWGDAADPNAIVGDGSIMSIISLTYAEYKKLEAEGKIQEDTEYHITDVSGAVITGGGSGVDLEEVQRMIDESIQEVAVPTGGSAGQVLKKGTNDDYDLVWGDAADPNAISGDGTIEKIVEMSYEDYLELKDTNELDDTTEYHISNWSENDTLRYTEEEVQKMIAEAVETALASEQRSAIMVTVGSNKTLNCESAWGTTVIPWDYIKYKVGDKFTLLENGRIKYTGNKPVKLTIHLQYSADDACGTVYPIVSSSSYYQEYCSPDHIFATAIGIEQGAPGYEFYGAVRTSGTGKKYVYTGNDGASPYSYFMVEEL
jgi:hypothetical protein